MVEDLRFSPPPRSVPASVAIANLFNIFRALKCPAGSSP
jgi:hypothetical protein